MSPNFASIPPRTKLPLSPAERLRRYRRGLRLRRRSYQIKVTHERINELVKRGYLGPNERDDWGAVDQAINLCFWDALRQLPELNETKRRGR